MTPKTTKALTASIHKAIGAKVVQPDRRKLAMRNGQPYREGVKVARAALAIFHKQLQKIN